jgi:hypothetical protein
MVEEEATQEISLPPVSSSFSLGLRFASENSGFLKSFVT